MDWDNASKWHIDHIIPISAFDLADPLEQRMAFHYTNVQPMWAAANLRKSAKVAPEALRRYRAEWTDAHVTV